MKFFLKSLFQSIYSIDFYKEAIARPTKSALKVFFVFCILSGLVWGLVVDAQLGVESLKIDKTVANFPSLYLDKDGLKIDGLVQPFQMNNTGTYLGVDTTGSLTEIPAQYTDGILLMKDKMISRSKNNYGDRTVTYSSILTGLEKDHLSLDKYSLASGLKITYVVLICLAPIWGMGVNIVVFSFKAFVVTLLGAIVIAFLNKEKAFENAFKIALYITIPVFYFNLIWNFIYGFFAQVEFLASILCLASIVIAIIKWGAFWTLAYVGAYPRTAPVSNLD